MGATVPEDDGPSTSIEEIALAREEWHAVRAGVLQAMSSDHLTQVMMIALEPTLVLTPCGARQLWRRTSGGSTSTM